MHAISLLASPKCKVSTLETIAYSGITACCYFIWKCDFDIGCKLLGILQSQSSFMATVNRVILPVMSNILQDLETNSLLVSYDGIMLMVVVGFRPLFLLAKFISLTSSQIKSSFGNHFIPATFIFSPSSENDSDRS